MAYTVSANFKTAIKDGTAPKSCLVLFDDVFFTTQDFNESGVEIMQNFNTSDDLTFGDCPSDTLSFTVEALGSLKGYGFGEAKVYLGVRTATASFSTSYNAYLLAGGKTFTARNDGFYIGSTKKVSDAFWSLVSDGAYVWAYGLPGVYRAKISDSTVSKVDGNPFMQKKLATPFSALFASNTATVWKNGSKETWEYVPMGVFNVKKPYSTVGNIVSVSDAYDRMERFDQDASGFLESLTYPKTLSQIYTALCSYVGVPYASATFTYSTTSYSANPFPDSSMSCRDILSWIAGRARSVAHCDRLGRMSLIWLGTSVETLTPDQVMADGFSIAEFVTEPVDSVILKATNGSSLTFGDSNKNPYQIEGNPFVTTITAADLAAYQAIMTYVPVSLGVFDADPSVDLGDLIDLYGVTKAYAVLADAYKVAYADRYGVAYAIEVPAEFSIPLMNRNILFAGDIRAEYSATGNRLREYDVDNTKYNALISVNEAQLSESEQASKDYADEKLDAFVDGTYANFVISTYNGITAAQNTADGAASAASAAQATANAKITTYYQTSVPTAHSTGDLWIDTDDNNKLYRWNGTTWVSVQDGAIQTALTAAGTAQATADKKIVTYAQTSAPSGSLDVGDLWIDTDDNNKLYRWSGSQWVPYTDSSAVVAYDTSLDQLAVFNKLTNNGQTQGIYLSGGKIYVNATYIKTGTLTAIAINNGNGTFSVDASGNVTASSISINNGNGTFQVDKNGSITATSGTIGGFHIEADELWSVANYYSTVDRTLYGYFARIHKHADQSAILTDPFIDIVYANQSAYPATISTPFRLNYDGSAAFGNGSLTISEDGALVSNASSYLDGRIEVNYSYNGISYYGRLRPYGSSAIEQSSNKFSSTVVQPGVIHMWYGSSEASAIDRVTLVSPAISSTAGGLQFRDSYGNVTAFYPADITDFDLFAVSEHSVTAGTTVAAAGHATITISVSKSGYEPIGLLGYKLGTNGTSFSTIDAYISGSNVYIRVQNITSSSKTLYGATATVLWKKS